MLILVTQVMGYDPNRISPSNFIPLKDIIDNIVSIRSFRGVEQFVLNMIMFVPIGVLFPIVFNKKGWNLKSIFLASFSITFMMELIQFVIGRAVDIDDIIANTLGGLVGYLLYAVVVKRTKSTSNSFDTKNSEVYLGDNLE